jgi:hypothetical protein
MARNLGQIVAREQSTWLASVDYETLLPPHIAHPPGVKQQAHGQDESNRYPESLCPDVRTRFVGPQDRVQQRCPRSAFRQAVHGRCLQRDPFAGVRGFSPSSARRWKLRASKSAEDFWKQRKV